MDTSRRLLFHAPNVHVGGGLSLLKNLLSSTGLSIGVAILDKRAQNGLPPFDAAEVHYVPQSVVGRVVAEWHLVKKSKLDDVVFCFHGLPPLFPVRAKVFVFLQNRILINHDSLFGYSLATRVRLSLERFMLRVLAARVDKFIVQTPSMSRDLCSALGPSAKVEVCPFSSISEKQGVNQSLEKKFDFVYVSSAEFHKNHQNLIQAWQLLAESDIKPSLALTLPVQTNLAKKIERSAQQYDLNVVNVGTLDSDDIEKLYLSSKALIFPSTSESFGLPLIEAKSFGLPILAPELDYVRDVVVPAETFDPFSPVSICRAVRRYLECPELTVSVRSAEKFITEILL